MTNWTLWQDYLHRARLRRSVLDTLLAHSGHADIVRESQELVELLLKGLLRRAGIDPPKWHDVGMILQENITQFPLELRNSMPRIVTLSSRLRKEREMSFYGDDDFVPSANYSAADSSWCMAEVDWLLSVVDSIEPRST